MVNDRGGLEIEFKPEFKRRYWKVQRVGWIVFVLILCAAIAGLLGPGLIGQTTVTNDNAGISLTYNRLIHRDAPSELKVQISPAKLGESTTRMGFNRVFNDSVSLERIYPEPESQQSVGDKIVFTFRRAASLEPMKVVLQFRSKISGRILVAITLNETETIETRLFSYP